MPKVSEEHRASRRDQILRAALRCFATRGFQATSMTDIIQESGLSAGAIYLYFPSKREIAAAVARQTMEARGSEIGALAHADPVPPPAVLIQRIGEAFRDDDVTPGIIVQLWGEATTAPEYAQIATDAFRGLRATLADYLSRWATQEQTVPADENHAWAQRTAPVLASLIQGYFLQSTLLADFDEESYFETLAHIFH